MTYRSQKNSRIFEFYKKGLLTKVRHIHSFQLFPTLTVTLLSFFWAFGQEQSLPNTEKDSIATNDTIPQNKAMLFLLGRCRPFFFFLGPIPVKFEPDPS